MLRLHAAAMLVNLLTTLPASVDAKGASPMSFSLTSPAFAEGGEIPTRYTCEGQDLSPPLVFYDRLQTVLADAGFDAVVEALCRPYYAAAMGAPSLPPGRYFRMHLVGYFEGIDSERGLEWRCADSLSLRDFLGLGLRDRVPDHSWLSRSRARLPLEVHERGFAWLLEQLAERGLVKGWSGSESTPRPWRRTRGHGQRIPLHSLG